MCRDFFVKTVERGGYRGAILVVIIGFRQWGGQERSRYGPVRSSLIYKYAKLLALEPSRGPKIGQGSREKLKSIGEIVWGPFLVS